MIYTIVPKADMMKFSAEYKVKIEGILIYIYLESTNELSTSTRTGTAID